MNQPPEEYTRIPHEELRTIVRETALAAGLPEDKSDRLGCMLSANDLRGVFSHGSRQIATYAGKGYARMMAEGDINPDPNIETIRESPVSVLVDGDGGLGYFPADTGTTLAIEKATEHGIAAMATRNHGHFGAAGWYARQALEQDLIAFVTSGVQLSMTPGDPIHTAAGGSPMSFCAPTAEEDPLVLDFGTMQDLYVGSPHREAIEELAPGIVLRSIGLGSVCQAWGGLLTGLSLDEAPAYQEYAGANQGAFALFCRVDLFADADRFKRKMDTYVRKARTLEPLDGFDPRLPGGPEAERERTYRKEGVPVCDEDREELETLAGDLGVAIPWA